MLRINRLWRSFAGGVKKAPKMENIQKGKPQKNIFFNSLGWDLFALEYANHAEKYHFPTQHTINSVVEFEGEGTTVEIACGSGYFGAFKSLSKPKNQKYFMFDLSQNMVNLAKLRVSRALKHARIEANLEEILEDEVMSDKELLEEHNLVIK